MVLRTNKISLFSLRSLAAAGMIAACSLIALAQTPVYKAPRTADGRPNLNGIWQALNTANWDLQGHAAQAGSIVALGAVGAMPGGIGVVPTGGGGQEKGKRSELDEAPILRSSLTASPEVNSPGHFWVWWPAGGALEGARAR